MKKEGCTCQNCGNKYQVDIIIPDDLWEKISPKSIEGFKGGGLLCPKCIGESIERISDYDCFKLIQMDDYQHLDITGCICSKRKTQENCDCSMNPTTKK